jgi:hypothetical protein
VERSEEWFKWRFDPTSQVTYDWVTADRGEDAQVWAVWGVREWEDGSRIDLMGQDSEILEAATSAAVRRARERGVTFMSAATNEPHAIQALKRCGFIKHGSLPLIVRSMTPRNLDGNIHDHASWRIYTADLDTF